MASLSWQLAQRYRKSRNSNAFIRFIAASSTIGIGLGVAILILALSVMNGFELALKDKLLSVIPHVELQAVSDPIQNWQKKIKPLQLHPGVVAGAPYIKTNTMIRSGAKVKAASLRGIDLQLEQGISALGSFVVAGDLAQISEHQIVLGKGIADEVQAKVGDEVQLMLPQVTADGKLASHKHVSLTVVAIVSIGGQLDYQQAWVDISALGSWLNYPQGAVQGFAFKIDDIFAAPLLSRTLGSMATDYVYMLDWFRIQGHLYNDIQMVRSILYLVLVLVLAVACFNIVATLVMAVREKQGDIAILLTMGMPRSRIVKAFMWLGWLNGLTGTLVGGLVGLLLAWQIEPLFRLITSLTGFSLLDSSIYFVDYVPSHIEPMQVVITIGIALIMSLLATIYPALSASKVQPAFVLGQR
ncbi:lipoprotein-releasing ABC transporter permease subunit [Rheinheimera sp. 1928-s]|uniref:lipoprotein-releasing ABC transporter permease subunit n=1 Tax=Rheinheimera sp. 1928-s TaxID=3033803 RepID=UPI00260356D5|nr:lipoprotein-releasing ABC transporter permease subunit [Rheinheimera sp. 1928-s]MDF3125486.1 lipoprotein-releasing ABC transporter permease subunit [Rheinheimera sp. 1928-s]